MIDYVSLNDFNESLYSIPGNEELVGMTIVISGMSGLTQQPGTFDLVVSKVINK